MKANPITMFDGKSVLLGSVFTIAFVLFLGAGQTDSSKVEALQQRFLVLESTPVRDAANGYQSHLLKVCPHYGKIAQDSLEFRIANETQEIEMIVVVAEGHSFNRGDIISFASMHHQRLTSGEAVSRNLPSGVQQLVP